MGKRGQPMRQHQGVSRTRLLRHRHPPPVLQVDNADAKPIDDTVVSVIPSHCEPLLPELNCLGNIGFEFLFCLYLHTALFCQYIYLYKTVWWYPISLPPSNTSLNFHQIDRTVTFFLSAFMFRRLIWTLLWNFFRPDAKNSTGIMAWLFCSCVIGLVWVCSIFTPILRLFPTTSWLNMTVLCYPILLWFPITALSGDSCLSLIASWMGTVDSPRAAGTETAEAIFSRHQLAYDTNLTRLAHAIASGNRKSSENPPEKSEETFKACIVIASTITAGVLITSRRVYPSVAWIPKAQNPLGLYACSLGEMKAYSKPKAATQKQNLPQHYTAM